MRLKVLSVVVACCCTSFALGVAPAGAPVAVAASCTTQHNSVYVTLSRAKYPLTIDHLEDAQAAGQPSLLHIDRADADEHRSESLEGWPTKSGYDRDEYPLAMSEEGGTGADVRYVPSSDNRGAGSSMGSQLSGWCDGQPFRFTITP
jgi:hypothetical protein